MLILAHSTVLSRNIPICALPRSFGWVPRGSCLNIHNARVSKLCFVMINTLWGECRSPQVCLAKKADSSPHFLFFFYTGAQWRREATATRWLAFRKSASSHEPWFFHIWRRADGWSLSSFPLLTTVKWSPSSFVPSRIEQATQKHLVDKGPRNLRDELIRQCLHCCAHKGNIICSQLVAFYKCSVMTMKTNSPWVKDECITVRESMTTQLVHSCFQTNRWQSFFLPLP